MKKNCLRTIFLFAFIVYVHTNSFAQVDLPHTLNFTTDDASDWADGIAQDGDGGSSDINGIVIQLYAANASFAQLAGATMIWRNAAWYTSGNGFNGITPGPEVTVSDDGVPAFIIKSSSQAVNFSLQAITLIDWGGIDPVISTYNNGTLVGTINVTLPHNGDSKTISQSNELTPATFNNIDEIRFYPQGGAPAFWIGFNNISLEAVTNLPVTFTWFRGSVDAGKLVSLQWQTAQEENASHFNIEQSYDGIAYATIGRVKAGGNSQVPTSYRFNYTGIPITSMFRLKQVDLDEKSTYSKTIILTPPVNTVRALVLPNPAKDRVYISYPSRKIQEVKVYTVSGIFVQRIRANSQTVPVDLTGLAKGVYYLSITSGNEKIQRMVIKE